MNAAAPSVLLDGNVLIALSIDGHVHREARQWLGGGDHFFATCPITQGTLVRAWLRAGGTAESAQRSLSALLTNPRHEIWVDDVGYDDVPLDGVVGHRQVTDTYLAHLARRRGGRLATLDRGLAAAHSDVTTLIRATEAPTGAATPLAAVRQQPQTDKDEQRGHARRPAQVQAYPVSSHARA